MYAFLNSSFEKFKKWAEPNYFGSVPPEVIESVPNEIFELIFTNLIPQSNEEIKRFQDLLMIGVVSKRFRSIVKEMPQYSLALQISKLLKDNLLGDTDRINLETAPVGTYYINEYFSDKQYRYNLSIKCEEELHLYNLENFQGVCRGDFNFAYLSITDKGFALSGGLNSSHQSKTYYSIDDLIKVFLLQSSFYYLGFSPLGEERSGAFVYRKVKPFCKYSFSYIKKNEIKDIYFVITLAGFKIEGEETIYPTIGDLHNTMLKQANLSSWL